MKIMNRLIPLCLVMIAGCAGSRGGGFGTGVGFDPPTNSQICNQHMKQVGTAMQIYLSENDDLFPLANWDSAITGYFDSKYHTICPALERVGFPDSGFAMNVDLVGWPATAVEEPSQTPLLFETAALGRSRVEPYSSRLTSSRHDGTIWKANVDSSVYEASP